MYVAPPTQRSDPSSIGGGRGDLRVYQSWKGSNVSRFFFILEISTVILIISNSYKDMNFARALNFFFFFCRYFYFRGGLYLDQM